MRCENRTSPSTRPRILSQETGVAGYLLKDDSFEELITAMQIVAAGALFMTPAIRMQLRELQRVRAATPSLSHREREVICLIAHGKTNKEIAQTLELSPRTVDTYRERLMDKLSAHTAADVVPYAVKVGLMD